MIYLVSILYVIFVLVVYYFVRGSIIVSKTEAEQYQKVVDEIKEAKEIPIEKPFNGVIVKEKSIVYTPSKDMDSILKNGEEQFFD